MVFKSVKGMLTGGQNCNNFRQEDDAVFVSDSESELQNIIEKVNETRKEYGME